MDNKGKINFRSLLLLLIVIIGIYLFFELFFIPVIDSAFSYSDNMMEKVYEAEETLNEVKVIKP